MVHAWWARHHKALKQRVTQGWPFSRTSKIFDANNNQFFIVLLHTSNIKTKTNLTFFYRTIVCILIKVVLADVTWYCVSGSRFHTSGHPLKVEVVCASYDYLLIVKEKFCCSRKRFSFFVVTVLLPYLIVFAAMAVSKRGIRDAAYTKEYLIWNTLHGI